MATFHYNMQTGKTGHSLAKMKYICREGKYSLREDETLVYTESDNLPSWAENAEDFWETADMHSYDRPFREIHFSLPNEISNEENIKIVQDYAKEYFSNHAYTLGIHSKPSALTPSEKNIHVHIMFSECKIDRNIAEPERNKYFKRYRTTKAGEMTGGYGKDRRWISKDFLKELRKDWEIKLNDIYVKKNINLSVSSDSLKVQSENECKKGNLARADLFDRPPMPRLSPVYIAKNIDFILQTQKDFSLIQEPKAKEEFLSKLDDKNMYSLLVVQEIKDTKEAIYASRILSETREYSNINAITYDDVLEEIQNRKGHILDQLEQEENKGYKNIKEITPENVVAKLINDETSGEYKTLLEEIRSNKDLLEYKEKEMKEYKLRGNPLGKLEEEYQLLATTKQSLHDKKEVINNKYRTPDLIQKASFIADGINTRNKDNAEKIKRLQTDFKIIKLAEKTLKILNKPNENHLPTSNIKENRRLTGISKIRQIQRIADHFTIQSGLTANIAFNHEKDDKYTIKQEKTQTRGNELEM